MTLQDTNEELRAGFNTIVVDIAFGVFDREDLPKFVERLEALTTVHMKKAEEHGYLIGWNDCVEDCPDKMSTEPYGAEEAA